jgi:transporter family protein
MDMKGWQIFAFGSAFFAGLTAIFGKVGVQGVDSNIATFIRTVIILGIIAVIITARGEWNNTGGLNAHSVTFLALSAAATGLSWLCYYRALQLGPASRVAPVDKLSVVFAIVLAVVFLGEKMTWKSILGGAFVAAGAVILALG